MTIPTNDQIRVSSDRDFKAIVEWLRDEEHRGLPGSFYCNLEIIESSHKNGKLLVYVDGTTGSPVAFQLGGLIHPGILEVKHDMRGRGIGRKLVEHCIERARARNECLLKIECNPGTSISFWKQMGFELIKEAANKHLAYRIIEKYHSMPSNGTPAKVAIRFYRDHRPHLSKLRALELTRPNAVLTPDGIVHLEQQVHFFPEIYRGVHDAVVRIDVEGKNHCYERARYPLPRRIGVQRCTNGFFIDRINTAVRP